MTKTKTVVLAALVSLFAITGANAQTTFKKSDKILEGTFAFSKVTDEDAEYSVSPSVGYFVTDRVAVGVNAEFGSSNEGDVTNLGAYARCYFFDIGPKFKTYSQLDIASNSLRLAGEKTSEFAAGVGLGANFFVSKRIALSAHISDLISYRNSEGTSAFAMGFTGFKNPIAMSEFGILMKL